jgi:serine/threonine protein kinase/tetratricopeptide (TPR) repeat protein
MSYTYEREVAVFEAALELPPDLRRAYLERTCAGTAELQARIERLLEMHETKAGALVSDGPLDAGVSFVHIEKPGDRIGPYHLLQQIGEGGCGVVYMAEQEVPIRRRVAFKIIKLGMDTRQVIARFEAERQALALMEHPNIAKVHDAGATAAGRPYFVMELVRGVKITDYCDEKRLSTHQRLELFVQVCQAVQHAHQKGIIHRDLKPSNILVTVNDGVAVPKVIDFGIAKATNGEPLTDKTVFTAFEQFIGTPAYMSPEQAEITSVDIDTRSDIYSLGVLLYELVTGQTPFDAGELLKAGLEQMRRTLRETEPARPSTRLSTLGAEELTTTANRRGLDAPRLVNAVRGDLDWIIMKCLEKDRARRYETANGLAMDLQRHLGNEPVLACPPSAAYRLQKFARRNRVTFVAVAAVALSLVAGLSASIWMYFRERQATGEQVRLRLQAQTESDFFTAMLQGVGPSVANGRDATLLHEILDQTAEKLSAGLSTQPAVEADLLHTIGSVYMDIGDTVRAESLLRRALALRRRPPIDSAAVAASLHVLSLTLMGEGKLAESETSAREAVDLQRKLNNQTNLAEGFFGVGVVLSRQNNYDKAEPWLEQALSCYKTLAATNIADFAWTLRAMAVVRRGQGRLSESEALAKDSLKIMRKVGSGEQIAWSLGELANTLIAEKKLQEAEQAQKEALEIQRKVYSQGNPKLMYALMVLGDILVQQSKQSEAEPLLREALEIQKIRAADLDQGSFLPNQILASTLADEGKLEEAETLYREAIVTRALVPNRSAGGELSGLVVGLTRCLIGQGKKALMGAVYRDELVSIKAKLEADDLRLADALASFASSLTDAGDFAGAEPLARECLEIRQKKIPDRWKAFSACNLLGSVLLAQKRYADAEPLLVQAYEGMARREQSIPLAGKGNLRAAVRHLVQLFQETHNTEEARKWFGKAVESGKAEDLNALAWKLATDHDARVRNGTNAVTLAAQAVVKTERKEPGFLDTLAAAYAEVGDFNKAVAVQREAVALNNDTNRVQELESHLKLFESGKPYHEPADGR